MYVTRSSTALLIGALILVLFVPDDASAQQPRPALTPADYGQFENLGAFDLDPTGRWLVHAIRRVDESVELRLQRSDASGETRVLEHGTSPVFSRDGRWMAYRVGVSPEEQENSDETIRDRLGLVDLASGESEVLFDVRLLSFRDDGTWLAVQGYAAADTVGSDLIVMNPNTGEQTLIGNVDDFAWQDDGRFLAATLRTAWGSANGVVLFDPDAGTLRTLDSRDARYRALTWRDDSGQLAVMRSVESDDREEDSHDVLTWTDVGNRSAPIVLEALGRNDLSDAHRVTDYAGIEFSDTGDILFVGLRPWEVAENDEDEDDSGGEDGEGSEGDDAEDDEDEVGPANVQVWHWEDDQIVRAQEVRTDQISRRTFAAAWHVEDDDLVMLGDELTEPVNIIEGGSWGLVPDYSPYLVQRRFGDRAADWYRVDVHTGARTLLAEGVQAAPDAGADDGRVLVYEHDRWAAVDLASLEQTVLADGHDFTRSLFDFDYPGPRPNWGVGAWVEGGDQVVLYDKHDLWLADLDGGPAVRVTRGAESGHVFRIVRMDPESGFGDANVVPADGPVWLSFRDERTKESGYATIDFGREKIEIHVSEAASVRQLRKARDAERYAVRMERWEDAPDVFVGGEELSDLKQVTKTNAFQSDFAWGRSELIQYTTDAGYDLQAILAYPANFREGEQYPLILYQYERLSDGLHRYYTPSERSYYNYQVWSQQGYFVLMPDIIYEPGRPGPSALDAVEHALDAAVATGHVDPDRMGLIGHSWGGYQASYLPTRMHRFAASVAGAAITNFLSFSGAVHWNGGLPELGHWETGQARMAVPMWEDFEGHLESSPTHFIQDLETPVLLMHGDEDGTVDFRQSLEYYNYARRAGKEVVMLVYPGADHGLREEKQQVDYHRRILEWFDHHLKGEKAAGWIKDGESWVERGKRIGN